MEDIVILDESGQEAHIDGKKMISLLRMAWNIGCAHGAQTAQEVLKGQARNRLTVAIVNVCLGDSWQNEEWCKNFVEKIYVVAMEQERNEPKL